MVGEHSEGHVSLRILRGAVDSLSLYEITDYELDLLEQGSPSSTLLNFGIAFGSVGFSFLIALLTVKPASIYVFSLFAIFAIVGLLASAVLLELWRRTRSTVTDVCVKIRARVPTAPVTEEPKEPAVPSADGATESSG